ncbi:hypothetical protein CPC08DRAFT_819913 [Agrocybe pediades]|nr:hypothetical protein CPC08DRAFT_819913 [Agrocybe pediades]
MRHNIFPLLSVIGFAFDMASAAGCINKSVVNTIDLHPLNGGPVIQMRTLRCLDNNNSTHTRNAREEEKRESFNVLEERTDTRCTASVCYCGIGCVFNGCMPVSQPIRSSDCNSIISSLAATPGTFSIQAGDGIGFAFESCEYTLFSTQGTQYCFSDMSTAAANIFAVCGAGQQGSCKLTLGTLSAFVDIPLKTLWNILKVEL